jgi:ureidoglycolate lyase
VSYRIVPQPLTVAGFAPFGRCLSLDGTPDPAVVATAGPGWTDSRTLAPLIDGPGSLGLATGAVLPTAVRRMERHDDTEEATFPAGRPFVLAVAPAADAVPRAEAIRAFLVRPGQAVVLDRGTWHDAAYGVDGPTPYYWVAFCPNTGVDEWADVVGEAMIVRPEEGP